MNVTLLLINAGVLSAVLLSLWLLSLKLRDSSIVDIFWGLGFVIVAWLSLRWGEGAESRKLLVTTLVTLWGVRLSGYLAWRNLGHGEDRRYQAMRARHGNKWPLRSLFIVFGLQGALMLFISFPVQVAESSVTDNVLTTLDFAGALLVLLGIAFESVGDFQLARFKAKPQNKGQVIQHGLWKYTRHPNYFGDFLVWWGLYAISCATPLGAFTLLSPMLMTFLLTRVSGVPLLEKSMSSRPGYAEYIARTSSFFPWFPKSK